MVESKKSEKFVIELRSDTFTKPTPKMLQEMITAEVGDAIYDEDPTIISLNILFGLFLNLVLYFFVILKSWKKQLQNYSVKRLRYLCQVEQWLI